MDFIEITLFRRFFGSLWMFLVERALTLTMLDGSKKAGVHFLELGLCVWFGVFTVNRSYVDTNIWEV